MKTTLSLKKPQRARKGKKPQPKPLMHAVRGAAKVTAARDARKALVRAPRDARMAAYMVLGGVLRAGTPADEGFETAVGALEPRDRAFVRLVVATTLRRLGQIDAVLAGFLDRLPPPAAQDALRLGAAQILFVGTPAHAAVATTVELVRALDQERLVALANAVLRRLTREGAALVAAQDAARLNTPEWLRQRWAAAYGEDIAHAIAAAHLVEPATDLSLKDPATAPDWAARLSATVLPTGSLRTTASGRVESWEGFSEGAWWVQDAAAALPAKILLQALGNGSAKAVADLCAAPGGKTLQLAAAGCAVTAVDISSRRLDMMADNLKRMNLSATVLTADALTWRPIMPVDAVLLDAPCSATGTIRRHPDLPYLKSASAIPRLAEKQRQLLAHAAGFMKPGGVLLYSVCSLEPEEGEGVVDAFLGAHPGFVREAISPEAIGGQRAFLTPAGDVRTLSCHWPELGGLDGFYIALLRKRN
ncbi:MAG: RsmB/NOP family class I SAM-dependent RNA methyltransferase [Rhodospirillaceae bacterium]|nr:RsmB/NOP family class I SAM-dependent RNA methyltransferase [Rhodospirillaceae bacterium]